MHRPTIDDLAKAAGVSVSTINRMLAGRVAVRAKTRDRVREAAESIGFYGLGAIDARNAAARPRLRLGVILLQAHRPFYQTLAAALVAAAAQRADAEIDLVIEHLEDLSPQRAADRLRALARDCDAIGLTSAVHPVVTAAVEEVLARGVHIFALLTPLTVAGPVHFVGLDTWKVGRTAGWAIANLCKAPGKVAILMGHPRFRNQEMSESGFRSYFREFAPEFTLLEPLTTFESAAVAQDHTESLLRDNPDLAGVYIAGGGISGVLTVLGALPPDKRPVGVGYEIIAATKAALLDGCLSLVIAHPLRRLAEETIGGMVGAATGGAPPAQNSTIVPFEIYTRENL